MLVMVAGCRLLLLESNVTSTACGHACLINLKLWYAPHVPQAQMQRHVVVQGHSRQRHPLIVHACTSSQNPLTTGQFFQHIQAYFTAHPPPFRVIVGPYPSYRGLNIVSNRQMRAARSAIAEAKFVAICAVLRAAGRERLAKRLFSGWKVVPDHAGFV